jgi:uncharacterized protein
MHPHVSFITLAVDDMTRAVDFYCALGLTPARADDDIAFFQLNGVVLALYGREALARDAGLDTDIRFRTVLAHNCADQAAVDRLLARATEAGARLTQPASTVFWGGYRGYFEDPDGHLWEVAYNPHLLLDPDGNARLETDRAAGLAPTA